jgi:hypothetical protein
VKEPLIMPLVNRDSATRWAGHLAVQFDVGELLFRFVTEKPFQRRAFLLAPWVLWLARRVQFIDILSTTVGFMSYGGGGSREVSLVFIFYWHHAYHGWRAEFDY